MEMLGFVIGRLSSTSTVALSTSTIASIEGVLFVSKNFRVSDPRLRRWSAPWIGWVGTGTAAFRKQESGKMPHLQVAVWLRPSEAAL